MDLRPIPALRLLGIGVTNRCNLACTYCSRSSGPWDRTDLPTEQIRKLLHDAIQLKAEHLTVAITGGEPLVRPDIVDVVDVVLSFPVTVSLNSNGLRLGSATAREIVRRGLSKVSVSLDGSESYYARMNRDGVFRRIVANMAEVQKLGTSIYLSCTVTPRNLATIPDLVRFAKLFGSTGISLSRAYPIGRGMGNYAELFVSWSDFLPIIRRAAEFAAADFTVNIEDNALRHLWDLEYRAALEDLTREANGQVWEGFLGGVAIAHVEANGDVLADPFLAKPAGNIHETSFATIWTQSRLMQDMRRRDLLRGACGDCEHKYQCGGHRGRAYAFSGDYFDEDPLCPRAKGGGDAAPLGSYNFVQIHRHVGPAYG